MMLFPRRLVSSFASIATLLALNVAACAPGTGASSGSGDGALCGAGRTGITPCVGSVMCQAGQYCNMSMLQCSPGCTSDDNCSAGEYCSRESGAAVGACTHCTRPSTGSGGTSGGSDPQFAACQSAFQRLFECNGIDSMQWSQGDRWCAGDATPAQISTLTTCVQTAALDCTRVNRCSPFASSGNAGSDAGMMVPGPDASTPADAGAPSGACASDTDCNTRVGVDHEICNGGYCRGGCRTDVDCGAGFMCDPDSSLCLPL